MPFNPSTPRETQVIASNLLHLLMDFELDIANYLHLLSDYHRRKVVAMRATRHHKPFALLCFLFFIVLRLWVLAIYEKVEGGGGAKRRADNAIPSAIRALI